MADAGSIVSEWKRRLVAMAESPPYVYRDRPLDPPPAKRWWRFWR